MSIGWPWPCTSIPDRPECQRIAVEHFNKPIAQLTACIETLIYNKSFFIYLRIKLPHQFCLSISACIRHIHITYLAVGEFFHFFPVAFDPFKMPQSYFLLR